MSERFDVRTKISNYGFEKIKDLIELSEYRDTMEFDYFTMHHDGYVVFGYDNDKWERSKEEEVVLKVFNELDRLVLEDAKNLDTCYYSFIKIDQEQNITKRTNDGLLKYTGDFYPVVGFSL